MVRNHIISDRPVPEPLSKALAYNNAKLIEEAARELQMAEETVLELFFELRLYLYLCFCCGRLAAPAHFDGVWHIFYDRKEEYQAFCEECFGGFIEHIPHGKPEQVKVTITVDRAHEKFGSRLASNWQRHTRCDGLFKAKAKAAA